MEIIEIKHRLKVYLITSILSIALTLAGFSYNVYRLEQSEINSNIRTSSFEMLKQLSSLEQIVYAAHYEKDKILGNPRTGWVKVGLIQDLGIICFENNSEKTKDLYKTWKNNWALMEENNDATNAIIESIDTLRKEIRFVLHNLN